MNLSSREKYILETFKLDVPIIKSISEIGRIFGSHKYDIWIAREVKKDSLLISKPERIYFILDWAKKEKPDITKLSFEESFIKSEEWHKNLPKKECSENKSLNKNRVLFKCSDNKHFLLLLTPDELTKEGNDMSSCVGGYKGKVKAGQSLIISLRDEGNSPHVTMEIDTKTCSLVQLKGKANADPAKKYLKLITEFVIFASGCGENVDEELLALMKSKFN
jgi:hypothetical protein